MKYFMLSAIGILILAAVLVVVINDARENDSQQRKDFERNDAAQKNLGPQTNSEGSASITVVPRNLADTSGWEFQVTLDTHSVELREDLAQVSVLTDRSGKEYRPISWEGDPPGGHHREGTLRFNPPSPLPSSITLKIQNVGSIPERIFSWPIP